MNQYAYNPYFYQNYRHYGNNYNQSPYFRNSVPFSIPKGNFYRGPMTSSLGSISSKATLSKVLSGTENVIATVNQVIPLYQQVKPLFSNSKIIKGVASKLFPFTNRQTSTLNNAEVVDDVEIVDKTKYKTNKVDTEEQKEPNKPFFG